MMRIVLFFIIFHLYGYPVHACDCDAPVNTVSSFESAWNSAEFVLEISIRESLSESDPSFDGEILIADVLKIYKGQNVSNKITILTTDDGGGSCQYPFESGKTYLVYGQMNEGGQIVSSICDRTGELQSKGFDLKLLAKK